MSNVISITGQPWQEADPDGVDPTEEVRGPDGLTPAEQRIYWLGHAHGWGDREQEENSTNRELLARVQAMLDAKAGQPAPLRLVVTR